MEQFKFIEKKVAFEGGQSGFANRVCKLIYNSCANDIVKSVKEGENLFNDFQDNLRNFYELTDSEIPLVAYYELKKYGAGNWDFTDSEYEKALKNCVNASEEYYS